MAVADKKHSFIISGTGDVLEPEDGIIGIGSGGNYALAAAKVLIETDLKAEEIKCKLSSPQINYENKLLTKLLIEGYHEKDFYLSKEIFEKILIDNNLLNHLESLLKDLLNQARGKFCTVDDLNAVVLVGGGTQIPLIKEWITEKISKIQIKSPPPIESIALGALAMTPGVKIKDILNKGYL